MAKPGDRAARDAIAAKARAELAEEDADAALTGPAPAPASPAAQPVEPKPIEPEVTEGDVRLVAISCEALASGLACLAGRFLPDLRDALQDCGRDAAGELADALGPEAARLPGWAKVALRATAATARRTFERMLARQREAEKAPPEAAC